MLEAESQCWESGIRRLAGVDEAGRGPLAGPVVAAAVVMDQEYACCELTGRLAGLTDSKQLAPARREAFALELKAAAPRVEIGIGSATVEEIDVLNILRASQLAMRRALLALPAVPEYALVDGLPVPELPCPSLALIKGDSRSLLIAAASIIAKTARDAMLVALDRQWPLYGFAKHKGYGSRMHIQALFELGPSPVHRMSFRPVREAADLHRRRLRQNGSGQ